MGPRAGFANHEARGDELGSPNQRFWGGVPNFGPPPTRARLVADGPLHAPNGVPAPQRGGYGCERTPTHDRRRWTRPQPAISPGFLWHGGRNLPHAQHSGPRGDPGRRRPAPVPGAPPLARAGRGGCGAAPEAPLECHNTCFYRRLRGGSIGGQRGKARRREVGLGEDRLS